MLQIHLVMKVGHRGCGHYDGIVLFRYTPLWSKDLTAKVNGLISLGSFRQKSESHGVQIPFQVLPVGDGGDAAGRAGERGK